MSLTESHVEEAALEWFASVGYTVAHGPDLGPGEPGEERASFHDVVLLGRLQAALARVNPTTPAAALDDALRAALRTESPLAYENNRRLHRLLTRGVDVEYRNAEGRVVHDKAWLVDFNNPEKNDWLVVNQYTIVEGQKTRRPDVVVFVNGLPLAVLELKNAADEDATIRSAFHQLQTYKNDIPTLFPFNAVLVVSDGLEARMGTVTSDWERFLPWRTIEGVDVAPKGTPELEVLLKGVFEKSRFLDLLRSFIVFEVDGAKVLKKVAGYHQFHAVRKAVDATVRAASPQGDRRVGVVWHTQGSGKSLSMVFYAARLALTSAMNNPTVVVLTDRNDLDDQLFGTFSLCTELLGQTPAQATNRDELRDLLKVASGGIIFTTIQKFAPAEKGGKYGLLSDRKNIVVVCDEAHRSQYDFIDGFARHMRDALPNASFLGFTGTPIEAADKSTPAVFGDYIDVYDIQRAVEDGATVRIYYEGRMARLELDEDEKPSLDDEFDEVTEGEEDDRKEKLKSKWARLEAMVGAEKRVELIAHDIVEHFERRVEAMDGKGMVVCMSRRICVELYDAIVKLRPAWHDVDDSKGALKIVMTGSASDKAMFQPHIRNKSRREKLASRYKDPTSGFNLVIVRDMWLTGFDAPCMHSMYIDKPMRGHGLMQAIARVNRVFRDKPGGLVVDYLGIADQLRRALSEYTEGDRREAGVPQEEAVALMQEKFEVVASMFHGFDYVKFFSGTGAERMAVLPRAMEHVLAQEDKDGKNRLLKAVTELSKAFALAVPHEDAIAVRDVVGFFQAVRAALAKTSGSGKDEEDLDHAVRQLVSKAVSSTEIVDIFAAAGLKSPDISILSDEFLAEVQGMPQRNLALELLRRLLNDEIKTRSKKNIVQSRSFSEMLEKSLRAYQNRSIETAQVIAELIELAKDMNAAKARGENLNLTDDEVAFYDALETNDSAVQVLGDETLRHIARELVETVKRNVTIDWTVKDSARAKLRTLVKRILRRYGYPPDKTEKATQTVLEQAEVLCRDWAA